MFKRSSMHRKKYLEDIHNEERPLMQLACWEFMSKLDVLYANVSKVGICYKNQRIMYSFPKLLSCPVYFNPTTRSLPKVQYAGYTTMSIGCLEIQTDGDIFHPNNEY